MVGLMMTLGACGSEAASEPAAINSSEQASAAEGTTRLWIGPDLVDCIGEAEQKCMQVADSEDGEYLNFFDQIEGFTFVEGTSYVVDVVIEEVADPPADGSSLKYTLVEIVS